MVLKVVCLQWSDQYVSITLISVIVGFLFSLGVVILEFKLAQGAGEVARLRDEGRKQIEEKGYAKPYDGKGRAVTSAVVVIEAKKRTALVCS